MKNFARLKKESPFFSVFENGNAPIINCMPSAVRLEGSDETEAYMLDVKNCSREQIGKIAEIISDKFGAPEREILDQISRRGMPIRASQIQAASGDVPAFL